MTSPASQPDTRKWSSTLLVWLVALVLIGDAGARLCFSRTPVITSQLDKYHNYYKTDRNPDVLVLGSSVALIPNFSCDKLKFANLVSGLNPVDYLEARYLAQAIAEKTGAKVHTANLAMNGSMVSDDWLIAQKSVEFRKSPKIIIYEMTSRDFFDASMPELGRTHIFSIISYLHPKGSHPFLPREMVKFADWVGSSPLATAVSTMLLDAKFLTDPERFRTSFDSILASVCYAYKARGDMRKWLTNKSCAILNRPSSVYESSRKALEERKRKDPFGSLTVAKTGSIEVDSRPQVKRFDDEIVFFERLLKLCKKEGIELIVVDMPMGPSYSTKVPPALKERYPAEIVRLCSNYGTRYLDFNRIGRFESSDFRDFIHLSDTGAIKFTDLLAEQLAKQETISSSNSKTSQ